MPGHSRWMKREIPPALGIDYHRKGRGPMRPESMDLRHPRKLTDKPIESKKLRKKKKIKISQRPIQERLLCIRVKHVDPFFGCVRMQYRHKQDWLPTLPINPTG